jgi:hypothetical protein
MKATRDWGKCTCGCGETIKPGVEMGINEGALILKGHPLQKKQGPLTRPVKLNKK